jgi:hypothetical protein
MYFVPDTERSVEDDNRSKARVFVVSVLSFCSCLTRLLLIYTGGFIATASSPFRKLVCLPSVLFSILFLYLHPLLIFHFEGFTDPKTMSEPMGIDDIEKERYQLTCTFCKVRIASFYLFLNLSLFTSYFCFSVVSLLVAEKGGCVCPMRGSQMCCCLSRLVRPQEQMSF